MKSMRIIVEFISLPWQVLPTDPGYRDRLATLSARIIPANKVSQRYCTGLVTIKHLLVPPRPEAGWILILASNARSVAIYFRFSRHLAGVWFTASPAIIILACSIRNFHPLRLLESTDMISFSIIKKSLNPFFYTIYISKSYSL